MYFTKAKRYRDVSVLGVRVAQMSHTCETHVHTSHMHKSSMRLTKIGGDQVDLIDIRVNGPVEFFQPCI